MEQVNYIRLQREIIKVLNTYGRLVGDENDPSFTDCLMVDELIKTVICHSKG
jgi:hypothetical protein